MAMMVRYPHIFGHCVHISVQNIVFFCHFLLHEGFSQATTQIPLQNLIIFWPIHCFTVLGQFRPKRVQVMLKSRFTDL